MMDDTLKLITSGFSSFWSQNSGEFISALAGALFGALAAFYFQLRTERQKETRSRQSAIIRTQMALISQLNILAGFRQRQLEPLRNVPERECHMTQIYLPRNCLSVDFESIAFLLESGESNLLLQIQVAERAYHSAIDAIDVRNRAIERLHERGELQSGDHNTGEFVVGADPRDMKMVKDFTDGLYSSTDHAEKLCSEAVIALNSAGKRIFPNKKFLLVKVAEKTEAR